MKRIAIIIFLGVSLMIFTIYSSSCTTQHEIVNQKSGAELWAQNCIRCHNIPSPSAYNDEEWNTIGLHMKVRANMTNEQITKIVGFMQAAN